MYEEEATQIEDYSQRLAELRACLNIEGTKQEIAKLEQAMTAQNFWDHPDEAQKTVQRLKGLKDVVTAPDTPSMVGIPETTWSASWY